MHKKNIERNQGTFGNSKFMKKTAAQEQEEQALAEQNKLVDEEHWYLQVEEKKVESNV